MPCARKPLLPSSSDPHRTRRGRCRSGPPDGRCSARHRTDPGQRLGDAVTTLGETVAEVPADQVPGFHASGVAGHSSTLRSIRLLNGSHALVIGARTHVYEGRGVRAVVHGV